MAIDMGAKHHPFLFVAWHIEQKRSGLGVLLLRVEQKRRARPAAGGPCETRGGFGRDAGRWNAGRALFASGRSGDKTVR
jgi:hypothetical protein